MCLFIRACSLLRNIGLDKQIHCQVLKGLRANAVMLILVMALLFQSIVTHYYDLEIPGKR